MPRNESFDVLGLSLIIEKSRFFMEENISGIGNQI
jgi:hypothetical protein